MALGLLKLIGLFTNLFFFQRLSGAMVSPAGNHLGKAEILVPVMGALVMAAVCSHGSPF